MLGSLSFMSIYILEDGQTSLPLNYIPLVQQMLQDKNRKATHTAEKAHERRFLFVIDWVFTVKGDVYKKNMDCQMC